MTSKKEQLGKIRDELDSCKRPLYLFDDDPDGLCSFLLLYRYKKEGKGVVVKSSPKVGTEFMNKVEEYGPDKIFILDKPMLSQDFVDEAKVPIVYVDHHEVQQLQNVVYFNPKNYDDPENEGNGCTTYWCHKVVDNDMWITMIGCIADWYVPPFLDEFVKKYPDLLAKEYNQPEKILYETKIGELSRVFSMILKGKTTDVMKCIKILTRIKDPHEILDETTPQGKLIFKRYQYIISQYKELLSKIKVTDDKIILFTYHDSHMSFTGDVSNELLYKYPKKIIIIAREKSGEMKCSIRSAEVEISEILKTALVGINGYGGGHKHACGACIKVEDFEKFVEQFRKVLN